MSNNNNLLTNLNKWAKRQNENFTTEAFVHLLRHLRDHQPAIASRLLGEMTGSRVSLDDSQIKALIINSQKEQRGRSKPDIEISAPGHLIFVEVKVTEDLGEDQLKRYKKALRSRCTPEGMLILLTSFPSTRPDSKQADIAIRWYQIAERLERELEDGHDIDAVSQYVINQFVEYMRGKNLILPPVKEGINVEYRKLLSLHAKLGQKGIERTEELLDFPTLYGLLMMMDKVIDEGYRRYLTYGRLAGAENIDYIGYAIQGTAYYFLICFNGQRSQLVFMTWSCQIDVGRFRGGLGRILEDAGPTRWQNELDLAKPGVQFFSESKSPKDRLQIIDAFYKESWRVAQQMTI